MRILKRNLAFVLAMVMALSLTAGAASVEYTDHNDIAFVEAVEVLSAMGVLEGTDGVFNPTKVLNRAEAAKIIAYLMLGEKTASNLKAAEAPFVDVPVNHWAAGYIAYCVRAGVVKGVSATEFAPKDELTATQFAAMLLRAAGYGKNGEYEGFGWDVNVNTDALKNGIYNDNLGVDFAAGATREEAALYAFNALEVETVQYKKSDEIYENTGDLLGDLYSDVKLGERKTDAFGRQGYVYVDGDGEEVTSFFTSEATKTYTKAVTLDDIKEDLDNEDLTINSVKLNGKNSDLSESGNGVLTEVYEEDDKLDIVMIGTYAAVVTDVDTKEEITTIEYVDIAQVASFETTFETTEFEEDDVVLVTVAKNKIQTMELAEAIEGELTAKKDGSYIKIDGEKYEFGRFAKKSILNGAKFDVENTLYVDSYGYAMYIAEVEDEEVEVEVESFAIITAISDLAKAVDADKFGEIDAIDVTLKVKDIATGETTKVALPFAYNEDDEKWEVLFNGEWAAADLTGTTLNTVPVNTTDVYGYNMTDDGVELFELAEIDATIETLPGTVEFDGTRTFGSYRLNDKTVTYVYDTEAKKANEYEGFKALKDLEVVLTKGLVVLADDNKTIVEAYLYGDAGFDTEDEEDKYAYVQSAWMSGTKEVTVDVVIDGDLESYVVAGAEKQSDVTTVGKIVTYTIDEDDEITLTVAAGVAGTVEANEGDYITVDGTDVYFGDVEVYDLTDDEPATVEASKIAEDDDVVYLVVDGDVILVYIV